MTKKKNHPTHGLPFATEIPLNIEPVRWDRNVYSIYSFIFTRVTTTGCSFLLFASFTLHAVILFSASVLEIRYCWFIPQGKFWKVKANDTYLFLGVMREL